MVITTNTEKQLHRYSSAVRLWIQEQYQAGKESNTAYNIDGKFMTIHVYSSMAVKYHGKTRENPCNCLLA